MPMRRVVLPQALRDQILRAAQDAHPRECCGLVEGACEAENFRITALHPARNLAGAADRFEIDPRDQFAAYKAARARGAAIVGCYHSHPHGRAAPSAADQAGAGEENFLWLIAGSGEINAFVYAQGGFVPVQLAGCGQPPL
ncbi:MAG TPA: M67 family metallopeptidase [Rhizomicrobium sp.]|nr:M67 family metallopeptidase [Rhizomicrobium sp.]